MATSPDFDRIKEAIQDTTTSWALEGKHPDDEIGDPIRKFLAYVLGGSRPPGAPEEMVLAWQYEGPTKRPVGWRCFKVAFLVPNAAGERVKKILFPSGSGITPPPPLTADQLDNQNCVKRKINGQKIVRAVPY